VRVAHIGWLASTHLRRRAEALAARGLPTLVVTDRELPDYDPAAHGMELAVIPERLKAEPASLVFWVEDALFRFGADLVHLHSTHYPASLGFFVQNLPRVTSIWDFCYSRDDASPLFHRAILEGLFTGELSEYVSFSSPRVMAEWIGRGFPAERALSHSWGVDLDRFPEKVPAFDMCALRERLGLTEGRKVIFSPRTPSVQANVDLLLSVLPRVNTEIPLVCLMTGHSLPRETLYLEPFLADPAVRALVRVVPPLGIDELRIVYHLADVMVSIHGNDHNPATLLEAMACGCLPLIQESSNVQYWVRDGENGFTAPSRDPDALADALLRALRLPEATRRQWAVKNRARIKAEADFALTLGRIADKDYPRVAATPPGDSRQRDPAYFRGLLADILGREADALEGYRTAATARPFLRGLVREKEAFARGREGMANFHVQRGHQDIRRLCTLPREDWETASQGIDYTWSMFGHDMLAGLYPLARAGRIDDYLEMIDILARRFHTGKSWWLAESVLWWGRRWGAWEFAANLLLRTDGCGASLAAPALETAEALGPRHPAYAPLLGCVLRFTEASVAHIDPGIDNSFRLRPRERALRLTAEAMPTAEMAGL
jgi:glycosyltransferase involved in cell wall biosynthesis